MLRFKDFVLELPSIKQKQKKEENNVNFGPIILNIFFFCKILATYYLLKTIEYFGEYIYLFHFGSFDRK